MSVRWPVQINFVRLTKLAEVKIMSEKLERKSLDSPDETRPFGGNTGKVEIVAVGGTILGRGTFEPDWVWSKRVQTRCWNTFLSGHAYWLCSARSHGCENG